MSGSVTESGSSSMVTEYVLDGEDQYSLFRQKLMMDGLSFTVRDVHGGKSPTWVIFEYKCSKGISIPFCGMPFIKKKSISYECIHGSKRYATKNDIIQKDWSRGTKRKFGETIKMGCPVKMAVAEIWLFPKFKVKDPEHRELKGQICRQVKALLAGGSLEPLDIIKRYYVRISHEHNHPIHAICMNQELSEVVKGEIRRLVDKGITNLRTIKVLLKSFAKGKVPEDVNEHPRQYYPTCKMIYKFVSNFIFQTKQSEIAQIALTGKVREWETSGESYCYYRCGGEGSSFLFCYQTQWQRDLMERYGAIVFLDATYKTAKYALPLYSLVVKTNALYIVVGIFVTEKNDAQSIAEALRIFKNWKNDWEPLCFITDYCDAVMNAVEDVFNCKMYICDFHRERLWSSWLKKKNNVPLKTDADQLIKWWRQLASTRTDTDFDCIMERMIISKEWSKNERAQNYFVHTWFPLRSRWTRECFDDRITFIVSSNNGIENLNSFIKHSYLAPHVDKSLCEVLEVIITDCLPQSLLKYQTANSQFSEEYKKCGSRVPNFLSNRPSFFVKRVCDRYAAAMRGYSPHHIELLSDSKFLLQSDTDKTRNVVNFSKPSCTCPDFQKFYFPCKHMCAVIINVASCSFEQLPESYVNSPYLTCDPKYSIFKTEPYESTVDQRLEGHEGTELDRSETDADEHYETSPKVDIDAEIRTLAKKLCDKTFLLMPDDDSIETKNRIVQRLAELNEDVDAIIARQSFCVSTSS